MLFSHEQLKKQFHKICDPNDWKNPIESTILSKELTLSVEAVKHFTATEPVVKYLCNNIWKIKSEGYRNGPAGDH